MKLYVLLLVVFTTVVVAGTEKIRTPEYESNKVEGTEGGRTWEVGTVIWSGCQAFAGQCTKTECPLLDCFGTKTNYIKGKVPVEEKMFKEMKEDDVNYKYRYTTLKPTYEPENLKAVTLNDRSSVLRVHYPKGSCSWWYTKEGAKMGPKGGTSFKALLKDLKDINVDAFRTANFDFRNGGFEEIGLYYEVMFAEDFNFGNTSGKLPGLHGGDGKCSGGDKSSKECFSTRFAFRAQEGKGKSGVSAGEIYAYLPNEPKDALQAKWTDGKYRDTAWFCHCFRVRCNFEHGQTFGERSFKWKKGVWNKVSQYIKLNTVNVEGESNKDGYMHISYGNKAGNGKKEKPYRFRWGITGLTFRDHATADMLIDRISFSTFFGGKDYSSASKANTHSFFRNIKLFKLKPGVAARRNADKKDKTYKTIVCPTTKDPITGKYHESPTHVNHNGRK